MSSVAISYFVVEFVALVLGEAVGVRLFHLVVLREIAVERVHVGHVGSLALRQQREQREARQPMLAHIVPGQGAACAAARCCSESASLGISTEADCASTTRG